MLLKKWDKNIFLHADIRQHVSALSPVFDQMMTLKGECFRQQEGRFTKRVCLGNKHYFIKQHTGVGWREIIKNILQGRLPVLSAKNEHQAINKLQSLGVRVPGILAYGCRGTNPANLQSFILMEELAPVISLETLCGKWSESSPAFTLKHGLILATARITRTLHENGINHRDLYICHFLLDISHGVENIMNHDLKLYLIDLHRAQLRHVMPERWRIKDLAGLYFSSMNIGLTKRDLFRFMKAYTGKSLRNIVSMESRFWEKVKVRGERLYSKHIAKC